MSFYQTHFQNAHHLEVNGGQFFNIANANGMIINSIPHNDPVSTTLWQHVAAGAIFDSAERGQPGKCHPGTRERMIERIVTWMDDPDSPERLLWLYGPAGAGKSALAHTICELLRQSHPEKYGGSFFFARGPTDRGNSLKLFATLSYQLALQFSAMRAEINHALSHDPSLPTKSMEDQLLSLIIKPFLRCQAHLSHSPVLVIDGLDECSEDEGMDTQRNIVALIARSIVDYKLPLRFMIASRQEYWIRDAFDTTPSSTITLHLSLQDDIHAHQDIKKYLVDGFEKIRVENQRIMTSIIPPWPAPNVIDHFVYQASGQYIYASTVLKFVGKFSRFSNPEEQVRLITSPGPHQALAFTELDRLYATILSAYPRRATMKRVLGGILAGANSTIMEIILGVDATEVILVLDALSALIDIEKPGPLSEYELLLEPIYGSLLTGTDDIRLCHLSFREFLEDKTRSGSFHIDVRGIHDEICRAFFNIICRNLEQNYDPEPHLFFGIGLATYQHMMFLMGSVIRVYPDNDTLITLITDIKHRLRLFNPDLDMDFTECFMRDLERIDSLSYNITSPWYHSAAPSATDQQSEQKIHELFNVVWELKDITFLSRQICTRIMSSSNKFRVTPTLAYLDGKDRVKWTTNDEIFAIVPGHTVADVLSTLQQHRHIINIYYVHSDQAWYLHTVDLGDNPFEVDEDGDDVYNVAEEGWRTRGQWRHQRISMVFHYLNRALDNGYHEDTLHYYLGKFFKSRNLSDIQTRKYFHNPSNLFILASMSDFSIWARLLHLEPDSWSRLAEFITPVLCWFNRQLTNLETLRLLQDHDENLVSRMRTTMQQIFRHNFFPKFRHPYYSELRVSRLPGPERNPRSIRIRVLPLTQSHYQEEEIAYIPSDDLRSIPWFPFHDEVFKTTKEGPIPPVIDHLDWHPYLASHLLNALVKALYTRVNPNFGNFYSAKEVNETEFGCIVECLPYAQPTPQNLDALRAIAYLYPNANLGWNPPADFWTLSVEFLKKYDRSMLSEEELNIFEWWMYSMRRYTKHYLSHSGPGNLVSQ